MAKILPDKEIRKLFGTVLINAREEYLNPNGVELRLGEHVLFHSTGEEKEIEPDMFLKVSPGENITIESYEEINFEISIVQSIFPEYSLMGFITPTTTMMREGITQVTTKIDTGFNGKLNWGLRNSSIKDLLLKYREPIFKLTIFALEKDEIPEISYGKRNHDVYQGSKGIVRSKRQIPADIQKTKIVSSSLSKIDPKERLQEAGYPFNHIGLELTSLQGKFEVVSTDVRLMKDDFDARTKELSGKIESVTKTLSERIEKVEQHIFDKVEALFSKKFNHIVGDIVGSISILYGLILLLQKATVSNEIIGGITILGGIGILCFMRKYFK